MRHLLSSLCAFGAALAALTLAQAAPVDAAPPALRGIDVGTALMMRDQARAIVIQSDPSQERLSRIQTIVIDPGHGGDNQGALGCAEVHEKFLTLELAFALRDAIQEKYPQARVILTRYWDESIDLHDRIALANEERADLFLSLHYNAAVHDRAVGVETYFLTTEQALPGGELPVSEPIASAASGAALATTRDPEASATKAPRQGVYGDELATLKRDLERATQHERSALLAEIVQAHVVAQTESVDRGVKQADFGVLRGALMPAVVVEAGFVTHPEEGERVVDEDHRRRVVEALMSSIEQFDSTLAAQDAL